MAHAFDVDRDCLRLDLFDILFGCPMRTELVPRGHEEGHRHLLDPTDVDLRLDLVAVEPVLRILLEPVGQAVHAPVLLRLDALALVARVLRVVCARFARPDLTDCLKVTIPRWPIYGVYAISRELHERLVEIIMCQRGHIWDEARRQMNSSV